MMASWGGSGLMQPFEHGLKLARRDPLVLVEVDAQHVESFSGDNARRRAWFRLFTAQRPYVTADRLQAWAA